jgi:REP element-mobilizing transposase RayT
MSDRWQSPLGCFLTFTTYGTWLHGDERGSVDRKEKMANRKRIPHNPRLLKLRQDQLRYPPLTLDASMRKIVREAIEGYCKFKGWNLTAINVRTNHVHCVILSGEKSATILNGIKARATRLLREAGLVLPKRPVWTEGGNRRPIKDEAGLAGANTYVAVGQGPALPDD